MTIPYQKIRGIYERAAIEAAAPVLVYVENQVGAEHGAADEYCVFRVNFDKVQETEIGGGFLWNFRGAIVCDIYTRKGIGPGRGIQIASQIIESLCDLNKEIPRAGQEIVARASDLSGPAQAQLRDIPHHHTRFSMSFKARYEPQ